MITVESRCILVRSKLVSLRIAAAFYLCAEVSVPTKILHTADWQLGKAFTNFPEDAAVHLREQRILTIKKIAATATQKQVDAVLVAGDVFEFENIAERTLHQVLKAMSGYTGPWLLIPGNHDPGTQDSVWSQLRHLEPPANIVILDKPQAHTLPTGAVVLAAPLQRKHDSLDITEWFDNHQTEPGTIRIGLAHGSVDNRLPDRGEAPNTISDTRAKKAKLDYLALGDWHGTLQIDDRTWYAGTPETDRFRDNESGNVLIVNIEEHGKAPVVEKVPVGYYTWRQLTPSIHDDHGAEEIKAALEALDVPVENLVVQLVPKGVASLKTRMEIEKVIGSWGALARHLEFKDDQLVTDASQDDLDQLGSAGFVKDAVKTLQAISSDHSHDESEIATLALQLLYAEHKQLELKR